ncbi:RNA polymerase sigma-70 factor (ECF subfamily) [Pleionea mediterranea]|uniref:RNA polymerase sigma factor n=1 Tax=Pleionea mediterranea TaxID=523701 RepID=A0A316G4H3_9GAMM|nr:RNA polymerase sigma-70 factor (ECF subfamily) [Pleionea mediterranea]
MANVVAINQYKLKRKRLEQTTVDQDRRVQNQKWIECLVKVAKTQDQSAFQSLFNHFGPKVKSFYVAHHLSPQIAEELVQETFISVWRYANYFESNKGQVSTWIYTIARNKKLDYFRKTNRQINTTELISDDIAVEPGEQYTTRIGEELTFFLPQLPDEQYEVIKKVYFEQLSHQKAADTLNITLGTVKGRIRSAVNNLNKLMRGGL